MKSSFHHGALRTLITANLFFPLDNQILRNLPSLPSFNLWDPFPMIRCVDDALFQTNYPATTFFGAP